MKHHRRYQYIDSIRAIAAISVIYYHVASESLKRGWTGPGIEKLVFGWLTSDIDLGKTAVVLFFCVSGYVIPFSLIRLIGVKHGGTKFLVSRIFRLYPAYWLSIPFGIFAFYYLLPRPISISTVVANITMLQQFLGIENIIGLYWTLQIELIFYGICFVLYVRSVIGSPKYIASATLVSMAVALVLAIGRYHTGIKLPVALPLALAFMFWAMYWRLISIVYPDSSARTFLRLTIVLIAVIPVVSLLAYNRDYGFSESWIKYTGTYYVAGCAFLLLTSSLKMNNGLLSYLGKVSYSIYLFGPVVQELALRYRASVLAFMPVHSVIALIVVLTIAVSFVVYHLIEKPFIELGRTITDGRRKPVTAESQK